MKSNLRTRFLARLLLVAALLIPLAAGMLAGVSESESYIVQARDMETAAALVRAAGGEITHELDIIHGVGALLNDVQRASLLASGENIRIHADRALETAGKPGPVTHYPQLVGADLLHAAGITGQGITVAVLDTGSYTYSALIKTREGDWRLLAQYDAIQDDLVASGYAAVTNDDSGHGSHVASVILSSRNTVEKKPSGIAPNASLVSVKAFDAQGAGSYLDVIRGLEWVIANKDAYNIRVLNLSFSAPPLSLIHI